MKAKEEITDEKAVLSARQSMHRKTRIIEWLVPRFYKGLSNPKNYEKLIGSIEEGG